MPFIASLVRFLFGFLADALPAIAARILLALGISFVSYKGLDVLIQNLATAVQGNLSQLPSSTFMILQMSGFTTALNILIAALGGWASLKMTSKVMSFISPK